MSIYIMGKSGKFFVGVLGVLGLVYGSTNTQASAMFLIDPETKVTTVFSHLYLYGREATPKNAEFIRREINGMWNENRFKIPFLGSYYDLKFNVTVEIVTRDEAWKLFQKNLQSLNNFVRIEKPSAAGGISQYMLKENTGILYVTGPNGFNTTAAHEYGHGLGLEHPLSGNQTNALIPSIMFARGTFVAPKYQYDPKAKLGQKGSTLNPIYREVTYIDLADLTISNFKIYHSLQSNGKTSYYGDIGLVSQRFY